VKAPGCLVFVDPNLVLGALRLCGELVE
jgi:hypothetical protein